MRSDLPVFEKCCFCVPLRWGLLTWGYFKLIIASLLLGYYIFLLHFVINLFVQHKEPVLIKNIVVFSVVLSTLIIDIIIHSIFIIGSHKKHVMYLKVYYFYALTLLVITIVLGIVSVDLMVQNVVNHRTEHLGKLYVMKTSALFVNLTIQAYVILLVRSEIVKLKKLESFRFLNNAAEGQLTLQCKDPFIKNGRQINNEDTNMAQFTIQAYVILLVRSEIVKLKKLESFRFLNNAAEGQLTLQCKDPFIKNGRQINNEDTNMAQFSID